MALRHSQNSPRPFPPFPLHPTPHVYHSTTHTYFTTLIMLSLNRAIKTNKKAMANARTNVRARRVARCTPTQKEESAATAVAETTTPAEEGPAFVQPSANDDAQISRGRGLVDPGDGSVVYGAPLGDYNPFQNIGAVFSLKSAETINGRMAQMGIVYALWREILNNESVFQQCYNLRDVGIRTLWLPKQGLFDAVAVFILVFAGSIAPALRGKTPNGLTEPGEKTFFFRPEAEMLNSRVAMVSIAGLMAVENMLGHGILQW